MIPVCSENHTQHKNKLRNQNASFKFMQFIWLKRPKFGTIRIALRFFLLEIIFRDEKN